MTTPVHITVIRHQKPDLARLAKALIALAELEARRRAGTAKEPKRG